MLWCGMLCYNSRVTECCVAAVLQYRVVAEDPGAVLLLYCKCCVGAEDPSAVLMPLIL